MKREFPTLWAKASTIVATPLIIVVAILYLGRMVHKPISEVYGLGLSAIGITAALSAICLSAGSPIGTATTPTILRYAGEKFLHSSLLLIQVLFLVFARDSIVALEWVARSDRLSAAVVSFMNVVGIFVAATAAWCWYWGFSELNDELWSNWRHRIEELNRSKAQPPPEGGTDARKSKTAPGSHEAV